MGLDSISLLDFRIPWEHTNSPMQVMTKGKKNFPAFDGTAVLDDGTKIQVKEFLGFAEKIYNKW